MSASIAITGASGSVLTAPAAQILRSEVPEPALLEFTRVLLGPAFDHDLLLGKELDRIAPLCVHDAEEAILPAAEREVGHGSSHADVNANISRRSFVAKTARRCSTRREERSLVAVRAALQKRQRLIQIIGMHKAQ